MIEVILPVLDEAAALPGVLGAMPEGYEPIVVDNGSCDGSAEIAAGLGARVVSEPRRGFGAACYAGLVAAESEVVCFMDCDGSLDPGELHLLADPVVAGDRELMLGARRAERGAWPLHARVANRVLSAMVRRRTGIPLSDIGPMRAAPRRGLLDLELQDRRFGWPLEMVLRASDAGWRIGEVEVGYRAREGRSKVTGTVGGTLRTVRDMSAAMRAEPGPGRARAGSAGGSAGPTPGEVTLLVIAKEPAPGRAKTRLQPALGEAGAARAAAAALADTLAAVAAAGPDAARRVVALDGEPGGWLPDGFEVIPQRGSGLGERLGAAFEDVGGPAFLVGMDTPQLSPATIEDACRALCEPGTDAVIGLAGDGGWWGLGLRSPDPGVFEGVPMSDERTGELQLESLRRHGLSYTELGRMRDVDTIEDARAVAAEAPDSRFARTLEELAAEAAGGG